MIKNIPKQTLDNSLTRGVIQISEESASMLKWFFILNLVMQNIIDGPYMMLLVRVMTIMFHLALTKIDYPSLPLMFKEKLLPFVLFDVTENDFGFDITSIVDFNDYMNLIDEILSTQF